MLSLIKTNRDKDKFTIIDIVDVNDNVLVNARCSEMHNNARICWIIIVTIYRQSRRVEEELRIRTPGYREIHFLNLQISAFLRQGHIKFREQPLSRWL